MPMCKAEIRELALKLAVQAYPEGASAEKLVEEARKLEVYLEKGAEVTDAKKDDQVLQVS